MLYQQQIPSEVKMSESGNGQFHMAKQTSSAMVNNRQDVQGKHVALVWFRVRPEKKAPMYTYHRHCMIFSFPTNTRTVGGHPGIRSKDPSPCAVSYIA